MARSLRNIPLVRMLAETQKSLDNLNARFPGVARGTVRATVVDVNDPQERGRVRVLFDAMNPKDIPQFEGSGQFSLSRTGEESYSHWIDVSPSFKGKQPEGLVGKRVNVILSNGQYQYAILQDVLYDPQVLTESSAKSLEFPSNSSMTRLPVYKAGNLPPPCKENLGCMVIEEGGPMNSDWVCVCLSRNNQYIWVRHSDLAHGHAGGNDVTSQVDSSGNRPSPGYVGASYDHVFVTSHQEMKKASGYFTGPAGNPWGSAASWNPPPMSSIQGRTPITGPLLDQNSALSVVRNSGFISDIPAGFISTYAPSIQAAVETVPGFANAQTAIETAQQVLQSSSSVASNPVNALANAALSTLNSYIPAATQFVISSLSNVEGTIKTIYPSIKSALKL